MKHKLWHVDDDGVPSLVQNVIFEHEEYGIYNFVVHYFNNVHLEFSVSEKTLKEHFYDKTDYNIDKFFAYIIAWAEKLWYNNIHNFNSLSRFRREYKFSLG